MTTPPVTLGDFKTFLNVTSDSIDGDLQDVLDEATELIEAACGPMVVRTVTERVRGIAVDGSFVLQSWPPVAVTGVALHSDDSAVDITSVDVDPDTGVVTGVVLSSAGAYDVTYTAGRAPVPGPLCKATKLVGKQLWDLQRGQSGQPRFVSAGAGGTSDAPVYKGFAWPNAAKQIVERYSQKPWC